MREYEELKCGCLVSEDKGGGLLPCDEHFDSEGEKGDPLNEYFARRRDGEKDTHECAN